MNYPNYKKLHDEYTTGYEVFIINRLSPTEVPPEFFKDFIATKSQPEIEQLILNVISSKTAARQSWVNHLYEHYHRGALLEQYILGDLEDDGARLEYNQRPILNLSQMFANLWDQSKQFNFDNSHKFDSFLWILGIELKKHAHLNFRVDEQFLSLLIESIKVNENKNGGLSNSILQPYIGERVMNALAPTHLAKDVGMFLSLEQKRAIYKYVFSKQASYDLFKGKKTKDNFYNFISEIKRHSINKMFDSRDIVMSYINHVCRLYSPQQVLRDEDRRAQLFFNSSGMIEELKNYIKNLATQEIKSKTDMGAASAGVGAQYLMMLAAWASVRQEIKETKNYILPGVRRGGEMDKSRARIQTLRWNKIERSYIDAGMQVLKAFHIPYNQRNALLEQIKEMVKAGSVKSHQEISKQKIEQTLALGISMRRAKMQGFTPKENSGLKFKV